MWTRGTYPFHGFPKLGRFPLLNHRRHDSMVTPGKSGQCKVEVELVCRHATMPKFLRPTAFMRSCTGSPFPRCAMRHATQSGRACHPKSRPYTCTRHGRGLSDQPCLWLVTEVCCCQHGARLTRLNRGHVARALLKSVPECMGNSAPGREISAARRIPPWPVNKSRDRHSDSATRQ